MHNREIRSRSLMNCLPHDTGVALLQRGNDKEISCYINITFTFSISKLIIRHDHSNFQDSLVFACYITTRQDPMMQGGCCSHVRLCLVRVWGTWEGVLGLGGGRRGYLAMPRNRCSVVSL